MKIVAGVIVFAVLVGFVIISILKEVRSSNSVITIPSKLPITKISHLFKQIQTCTKEGIFAVFMFNKPGQPGDDGVLNLQFSIEKGLPGFDWVLLVPGNISDKDAFLAFAEEAGYSVLEKEINGVAYLRVESGNLPKLCTDVITKLYQIPESDSVELIIEGFDYQP